MKETVVIATHNVGKMREFEAYLSPLGVQFVSSAELNIPSPIENGTTFLENARIKAQAVYQATNFCTIADDSGLCVAALNGDPGVYTADWAGGDKRDWPALWRKLEIMLEGKDTACEFHCCLVMITKEGKEIVTHDVAPGRLVFPARGKETLGLDPIFSPIGFDKTYAELSYAEKNQISHRSKALKKMLAECMK